MDKFFLEESEVMTLGAILKQPNVMDDVVRTITANDFYLLIHQEIYQTCVHLYEKNQLDIHSVVQLSEQEEGYIRQLPLAVPTLHLVQYHAEKIRNSAILRRGDRAADEIKTLVQHDYDRIDDFITQAHQIFNSLEIVKKGNIRQVGTVIHQHLQEKFTSERQKSPTMGLKDIDQWMHGIGRERLLVVAGRPGTGKTAFALKTSRKVAQQDFGPVAMFSLEMSESELIDRMLADLSGVGFSRINRNELLADEKQTVEKAAEYFEHLNLYIDDTPRMDMPYISAQARKLKREHGSLGMIVIDYLELIDRHERPRESTNDSIGRITRELKNLARELQCSIMLLVQMNREIEKRSNKRPLLSDLRNSGNIEQDADMVAFLHRNEDASTDKISMIDLIVAKGRQTGLADFELAFYGEIQRMTMAVKT